jgi:hypothetical protein
VFVGRAPSRFWLSVVHVGFGGATMSALLFGLAFTGHRDRLIRRNVAALLVVPVWLSVSPRQTRFTSCSG